MRAEFPGFSRNPDSLQCAFNLTGELGEAGFGIDPHPEDTRRFCVGKKPEPRQKMRKLAIEIERSAFSMSFTIGSGFSPMNFKVI